MFRTCLFVLRSLQRSEIVGHAEKGQQSRHSIPPNFILCAATKEKIKITSNSCYKYVRAGPTGQPCSCFRVVSSDLSTALHGCPTFSKLGSIPKTGDVRAGFPASLRTKLTVVNVNAIICCDVSLVDLTPIWICASCTGPLASLSRPSRRLSHRHLTVLEYPSTTCRLRR